jgi:predicted TIM-barrel fold metal-dependent hydrolase
MHIVDPSKYPLAKDALYTPNPYRVHDAETFERSVGLSKVALVQPSIYGSDNSCLLDALRHLGPERACGVVVFDPSTTQLSTLQEWHDLGVRGVRVNLQSVGRRLNSDELQKELMTYADAIRPLGWVVQVYVPMAFITALESVVPKLGVRLVIDHMGHPSLPESEQYRATGDPYSIEGFGSLMRLLKGGQTFVKLSAPYRLGRANGAAGLESDFEDLAPVACEIIRQAGMSSVVFATDWPHTRFEGLDIRPWMETVLAWCGSDPVLVERLFRGNAEDLWQPSSA